MRSHLIAVTAIALGFGLWACEDDAPAEPTAATEQADAAPAAADQETAAPSAAQLKAEAAKEITADNVEAQAEALLKEIGDDLTAEGE